MSSAYQTMIDAALRNGAAMASTGVEKTASDPNDMYKEASELANALEYMAISSVDDGTAAGVAQSDMIKDFFKQASKQRMGVDAPAHGSTAAAGTQGLAPQQGRTILNKTQPGLVVSSSLDSKGKTMLESYKQASLYDILMGKHAAHGEHISPMQYTSEEHLAVNNSNENSVRSVLDTNESAAMYQKRDVHGSNIRSRLAEAFAGTNDTLSDATVQSIFPQAYSSGGLKKTASTTRNRLNKLGAAPAAFTNQILGRAAIGGGAGAALGGIGGYMAGGDAKSALTGAAVGGTAGALGAGLMQRAAAKNVAAAKQGVTDAEMLAMQQGKMPGMPTQSAEQIAKALEKEQKGLQGLEGAKLTEAQKRISGLQEQERLLNLQAQVKGMNAEQLEQLQAANPGIFEGKTVAEVLKARQDLVNPARAALEEGMMAQGGVGAAAGALGGIGGGMMMGGQKQASSPLSARSRLRKMQRGL